MYLIYIVVNDKQEVSNRGCDVKYYLSFNLVFPFIVGSGRCAYKQKEKFGLYSYNFDGADYVHCKYAEIRTWLYENKL